MTRLTAARFLWRVAIALATVVVAGTAAAQQPAAPVESGTYRLYKFEQPIGEETYSIGRDNDAVVLTDKFLFTDRGTRVPLDTIFRAGRDLTPRSFESSGKSSRVSNVDVSLRPQRDTAPKQFFIINGYSPVAQQMLMLRYWLGHGSPLPCRFCRAAAWKSADEASSASP
jgi:hypothetical protein